jgi:hypothetical protein
VTSHTMGTASVPASLAASTRRSFRRANRATVAPRFPRPMAIQRPSPLDAPTTTVLTERALLSTNHLSRADYQNAHRANGRSTVGPGVCAIGLLLNNLLTLTPYGIAVGTYCHFLHAVSADRSASVWHQGSTVMQTSVRSHSCDVGMTAGAMYGFGRSTR